MAERNSGSSTVSSTLIIYMSPFIHSHMRDSQAYFRNILCGFGEEHILQSQKLVHSQIILRSPFKFFLLPKISSI